MNNYLKYILIYFILINLISFFMFYVDKQKARQDKWRIKEKTLHLTSFLGGTLGSIVAMIFFHHKTKKPLFVVITGIALIVNIFAIYELYTRLF